jgi:copper chaperone CopZ
VSRLLAGLLLVTSGFVSGLTKIVGGRPRVILLVTDEQLHRASAPLLIALVLALGSTSRFTSSCVARSEPRALLRARTIPPAGIVRRSRAVAEIAYTVPGMHCAHCERAVSDELQQVEGADSVEIDLDAKLVTVRGVALDDAALRAAIDEAGYEVA